MLPSHQRMDIAAGALIAAEAAVSLELQKQREKAEADRENSLQEEVTNEAL